jgi:hypothetical protein
MVELYLCPPSRPVKPVTGVLYLYLCTNDCDIALNIRCSKSCTLLPSWEPFTSYYIKINSFLHLRCNRTSYYGRFGNHYLFSLTKLQDVGNYERCRTSANQQITSNFDWSLIPDLYFTLPSTAPNSYIPSYYYTTTTHYYYYTPDIKRIMFYNFLDTCKYKDQQLRAELFRQCAISGFRRGVNKVRMRSFGILRSVERYLLTDVSGERPKKSS